MPLVSGSPPNSGRSGREDSFSAFTVGTLAFLGEDAGSWTAAPLPGGKPVPSGITASPRP